MSEHNFFLSESELSRVSFASIVDMVISNPKELAESFIKSAAAGNLIVITSQSPRSRAAITRNMWETPDVFTIFIDREDPYSENELEFLTGPMRDKPSNTGFILIDETAAFPYEMMDLRQRIFSGTQFRRHIKEWMAMHPGAAAQFFFLPELSESLPA